MLLRYFRNAHRALKRDGLLFLDAFGGYEASREMEEYTPLRRFTYVWDQAGIGRSPAISSATSTSVSRTGRASTRPSPTSGGLWTLPELRELLAEAGFRRVTVYWEGA